MTETQSRTQRFEIGIVIALLGISVVFLVWALSGGWSHPILDAHGFRQTQTAISVRALLDGGPLLAYETPVLGVPWAIPFEFPLYQWIVGAVTTTVDVGIDQAGRAVSIVAYLASVAPIWYLLSRLGIHRQMRLVFLALYFVSPIYVFWSRTVMIESLALFLGFAYLALVVRYLEKRSMPTVILASGIGVLASMVKITTFVPFCLLAVGALGLDGWRRRNSDSAGTLLASLMPGLLAAVAIPVGAALAWTRFADETKAKNAIARGLTSNALREWNFGTLEQRLDIDTWNTLGDRLWLIVGGGLVLLAAGLAVMVTNRYRAEFTGSVAVGLVTFLIFTNLHYVHDYYQYAIGVFFIAAVGFGIVALLEQSSILRWAGYALLSVAMLSSMLTYTSRYRPLVDTASKTFAELARVLDSATSPDDVVVVIGAGWSSEIAYRSDRRAVMISSDSPSTETVATVVQGIEPQAIGAMVVCSDAALGGQIREWVGVLGVQPTKSATADGCNVHLRADV